MIRYRTAVSPEHNGVPQRQCVCKEPLRPRQKFMRPRRAAIPLSWYGTLHLEPWPLHLMLPAYDEGEATPCLPFSDSITPRAGSGPELWPLVWCPQVGRILGPNTSTKKPSITRGHFGVPTAPQTNPWQRQQQHQQFQIDMSASTVSL